jgi:hypothetical protein
MAFPQKQVYLQVSCPNLNAVPVAPITTLTRSNKLIGFGNWWFLSSGLKGLSQG